MKIEYKDGKMIVTHSTGHIDIYNKADIEMWLEHAKAEAILTQANVAALENHIETIDSSVIP